MITILIIVLIVYLIFFKNKQNSSEKNLNRILIANLILFFLPITISFLASLPDGNMWSENGPGVTLWSYIFILPFCVIVLIILIVLKLMNTRKKRKEEMDQINNNQPF